MNMDKINEFIYFITAKPYFVTYVLKNGRKIQRFIQGAASKEKGTDVFLISKSLECAWFKPDKPVIDGLKFLCFVDINNAIPLSFETETEIETTDNTIKEKRVLIIKENLEKQKSNKKEKGIENTGRPEQLSEIPFPPNVLFQKVDGFFIKQILTAPENKNQWLMWVLIVAILVFGFIFFTATSGGGKLLPF